MKRESSEWDMFSGRRVLLTCLALTSFVVKPPSASVPKAFSTASKGYRYAASRACSNVHSCGAVFGSSSKLHVSPSCCFSGSVLVAESPEALLLFFSLAPTRVLADLADLLDFVDVMVFV